MDRTWQHQAMAPAGGASQRFLDEWGVDLRGYVAGIYRFPSWRVVFHPARLILDKRHRLDE